MRFWWLGVVVGTLALLWALTSYAAGSLRGDVNDDGGVTPLDALLILQFDAGIIGALPDEISTGESVLLQGDVDGDGNVTPVDALMILQLDAGVIATLPDKPTPTPVPGGDRSLLPLPDGFTVNRSGCSRDGACISRGTVAFYAASTREAVVRETTAELVVMHETCHAHQHRTLLDAGLGAAFDKWATDTEEGQSYVEAAQQETGPWAIWALSVYIWTENFAGQCANYYLRPEALARNAPVTYEWMRGHLP
ncbi:MAG: hypothetical protein A2991_03005 [Candidatus Terrybacteria bacterium RIFCSPLOWO2_01_FULL_58_14]|uniref:Dockerin domain-containing protein n=2 Tax=Candidatus Terryibacteriota TaxID=1817920 RepID=A0A1G2PVM2_9BACT|nr:MAG: hypothetical protein A2682_02970 [Candidatus Terrybacteria bacterium RIFCSPHIGHO2_01_FULL_58_15]OHA52367.1 MAG: hypothetical protein A2991_03005 [Candidatus Terrybacteria bacterium RIFCSPLOWO2_01_FULL_58_14]